MNLLARNPVEKDPKTNDKNGQPASKPRVPIIDKPMPSKCIKIQGAFDARDPVEEDPK
jgi:RNA-binding protein 39